MANGRKIPSYPSYQENIQRDDLCSACGSNKRLSMSIVTRMVAMSNRSNLKNQGRCTSTHFFVEVSRHQQSEDFQLQGISTKASSFY